jgi:DNA-binding NarL/FixJ family response regulator
LIAISGFIATRADRSRKGFEQSSASLVGDGNVQWRARSNETNQFLRQEMGIGEQQLPQFDRVSCYENVYARLREKSMKALRILIADDHDLMRRGVKALLQSHAGWEICGEAHTGREAVTKAEELKPDVAILDISMPDLNGIEAARRIRKASANTEVLILSVHYSDQLIRDILEAGVKGYIVKSDSDRDLIIAVETLANHKPFFTPRATEVILSDFNSGGRQSEPPESVRDRLTSREREIVQLLAEGKSSKEVASSLCISVKTAETHRSNIMRKLQLHTVTELVRYAIRNQIIEP